MSFPLGGLGLTLGLPALVWVVGALPAKLPGMPYIGRVTISRLVPGLAPFITAFVLVELGALAVPRWRALRVGGPFGRRRLERAALALGLLLCAQQVVAGTVYLHAAGVELKGTSWLALGLGGLMWPVALVAFARVISRRGLTEGFAALLAVELIHGSLRDVDLLTADQLLIAGLVLVGMTLALELVRRRGGPRRLRTMMPLAGFLPATVSVGLVSLPHAYLAEGVPVPEVLGTLTSGEVGYVTLGGLALVWTGLFSFLFHRRAGRSLGLSDAETRAEIGRALPSAAGFALVVALAPDMIGEHFDLPLPLIAPAHVALGALALDLVDTWRWKSANPTGVPVWPVHRLYVVDGLVAALEEADIPVHARGQRYRSLLHFFGPYAPVQVMVPAEHAERAVAIIEEHLVVRASEQASLPRAL